MGKLFYSVCGEGRGHATRAKAIIEELSNRHEVVIYAPAMAYDLLAKGFRNTTANVRVNRLPGIFWHYSLDKKVDYVKTLSAGLGFLRDLRRSVEIIRKDIEIVKPDLAITDFEPILPRAAHRCGIPYISLDHQHFLLTYDLRSLPLKLRTHAALMGRVVRTYYDSQAHTIVSSFYFPPLKNGSLNVSQIGVILGPDIRNAHRTNGRYLVAYFRRFITPALHRALAECGCEVRIYGLGDRPAEGRLKFFDVDIARFSADLAGSRALVSTAGNQLIGEALYLGKPVFAMPEPRNSEQQINAHFLETTGGGMVADMQSVQPQDIKKFVDHFETTGIRINPEKMNGNAAAMQIINLFLDGRTVADSISRLDPCPAYRP